MTELLHSYHLVYNVIIIVISAFITLITIPSVLHVAQARHLYDDVGHFRKQHDHGIPRLGGVAIFVSFMITILLFSVIDKSLPVSCLLVSCIILFAMGLKDDLSGVNSSTKFFIQFVVAAILVLMGDIRVTSLFGVFGIYSLPYIPSAIFSILLIMLIVNSFNLIDGIDGLAATTGIVVNGAFAFLFIYMKQYELAAICLAMVGAVAGFLRYNITPAKIFMGDTGALLIGLISAVMAIKYIEVGKFTGVGIPHFYTAPALTVAILIGPVFDTLRVFTIRILSRKSPFEADRNHMHHRMLKLGMGHIQVTLCLSAMNIAAIMVVLYFRDLSNTLLVSCILLIPLLFNWFITYCIRSKERESLAPQNQFV
ncbi:MAG: MraY family glycosyltransferase [Mucilaginibacter sp.]|uniref:MraY family glycosyltransferase n=1 Tax=Mucilaginibacter sp. TaxID=1882438 RepID=UPI0031A37FB6